MDWPFAILLVVFVLLIVLSPKYRNSKAYKKNLFYASDITSMGSVSNIEVFEVQDKELGPLVGLVFKSTDVYLPLNMTRADALDLADMLEADALSAEATRRSNGI